VIACRVLGISVQSVMITRAPAGPVPVLAGATRWEREPMSADVLDVLEISGPLVTWPWPLRERLEREVLMYLAGDEAERLVVPRAGRVRDPVTVRAAELASDADRQWQAAYTAGPGDPHTDSDAARVAGYLFLAFGRGASDESLAWLAWCQAAARSLVAGHAEEILRLADALSVHGVLGAEGIAASIRG